MVYAVPSPGPLVAPTTLLRLWRAHWSIGTSAAPQVMAVLRNVVLVLLRHAGSTNLAVALRACAWQLGAALHLLGLLLLQ